MAVCRDNSSSRRLRKEELENGRRFPTIGIMGIAEIEIMSNLDRHSWCHAYSRYSYLFSVTITSVNAFSCHRKKNKFALYLEALKKVIRSLLLWSTKVNTSNATRVLGRAISAWQSSSNACQKGPFRAYCHSEDSRSGSKLNDVVNAADSSARD